MTTMVSVNDLLVALEEHWAVSTFGADQRASLFGFAEDALRALRSGATTQRSEPPTEDLLALGPERRAPDGGPERVGAVGTGAREGNRGDDPRGTPRPRARAAGELRRIGRDAHALLSVRALSRHRGRDRARTDRSACATLPI